LFVPALVEASRVRQVAQAITQPVEQEDDEGPAENRKPREPGGPPHVVAADGHHCAPSFATRRIVDVKY